MAENDIERRLARLETTLAEDADRWAAIEVRARALPKILACIVIPLKAIDPAVLDIILMNLDQLVRSSRKMNQSTPMIEDVRRVRRVIARWAGRSSPPALAKLMGHRLFRDDARMIRDHVRSKRESGIVAVARLLMDAESDLFRNSTKPGTSPTSSITRR